MPIRILDKKTVELIAAGEVIERPASVVKELVENALDAGTHQITIETAGGGLGFIRVTDDGCGIGSDEVELAFARHATSKIASPLDLDNIKSLGFRGEALPSVAAVATVEMLTRREDEEIGTFVRLEDGVVTERKRQARVRGTTVTVRELFRGVPARLKFLKSAMTENAHIARIVSQYALAYPEVGFTLVIDGKNSLRTPGTGRLADAVLEVYSAEVASQMLTVDSNAVWPDGRAGGNITVSGMVGAPGLYRTGRGHMSFFVNRRWVSNRIMAAAVEEAYHGLLMTGRHPVVVLNIDIPASEIDVNIHPTKAEIKFRDETAVFRTVQRAVRQAILARAPAPRIEEVASPFRAISGGEKVPMMSLQAGGETPAATVAPALFQALPVLRVLGQVFSSYIVAEGPDGLYLIDQHAAHERVRLEELWRQRARGRVTVQGLLQPRTIELAPRQDVLMRSVMADLAGLGFDLEPFGERTYLVRAVPALVAGEDWPAALRELLDSLAGEPVGSREEKILITMACHGAIRAGQVMEMEEMRALVRQLEQTASPNTCPHGRPTVIRLSRSQLEKEFGRS